MSIDSVVSLELSGPEALVLFELLYRWSSGTMPKGNSGVPIDIDSSKHMDVLFIDYQAELRVLWDILSMLERRLVEPLKPDYLELLRVAREVVRDEE